MFHMRLVFWVIDTIKDGPGNGSASRLFSRSLLAEENDKDIYRY